jgi:hypothetical protein
MPNYFPEGDAAAPADTIERSMAKVVSQLPGALDVLTEELIPEPSFAPTDLPELELWLDANEGVFSSLDVPATNGQSVRQWKNLVSGKPNVEQSSANIQPFYYDALTEENKPSVLFSGDGFLEGSGFSTWGSQFTYYVVARDLTGQGNNGAGVLCINTSSTISQRRGLFSVNTGGDIQASNGTLRTFSLSQNLNETEIFSMGFDITNNQVNATITNIYGTAEGSVSGIGASSVTTNGITIGTARNDFLGTIYGEIREILVYKALHSVETRNQIINYLSAKWGVFTI